MSICNLRNVIRVESKAPVGTKWVKIVLRAIS